ncbi:MAG: hypothetical protein CFE37_09085 [Alphaproteobacteria bacterium PA4]|nr:MAG: hypothetical protein CFE37_09085 [Alphaproteobacteria bacterium PA4]
MIVVDASLAAKWLLWEADSQAALQFLGRHRDEICGPDILFVEVASAIVRRGNMDKRLGEDALRALDKWTQSWRDHAVRPYPVTPQRLFDAGKLALALGHQIYDCLYLALAIELDGELVTCDIKFAEKAIGVWPRVRLLADVAG